MDIGMDSSGRHPAVVPRMPILISCVPTGVDELPYVFRSHDGLVNQSILVSFG